MNAERGSRICLAIRYVILDTVELILLECCHRENLLTTARLFQAASVSADSFLQTAPRYRGVVSDQLPPIPAKLLSYDLPVPVSVYPFTGFENLENVYS
jgi:hypothetical protein